LFLALILFDGRRDLFASKVKKGHWVGTWACAPLHPDRAINQAKEREEKRSDSVGGGITIREVARISLGGDTLRVRLSNLDGTGPLVIGAAEIARSLHDSAILPGSSHHLTFRGQASVTIPAGALVISDPVWFSVPAISDLAVSLYLSSAPEFVTEHQLASASSFHAHGDVVLAPRFESPEVVTTWEFLNGIDVFEPDEDSAIITIGDSITDGAYSTANANQRWPDELARRLQADKKYRRFSVLNEAISGNKVLLDRAGPNALARFDRDVLAQSGARYLIVLEGINDIGHIQTDPDDRMTASDLIFALDQMISRAHAHGIAVIGGTLTPYRGFTRYYSAQGEAIRIAVNQWIRSSGTFDGVIDFDAAVRDPSHPDMFLPAYDHGDHLHPNDAGYRAMGDFINLGVFSFKPKALLDNPNFDKGAIVSATQQ
jgi:lysophospholipase L1-like esterase